MFYVWNIVCNLEYRALIEYPEDRTKRGLVRIQIGSQVSSIFRLFLRFQPDRYRRHWNFGRKLTSGRVTSILVFEFIQFPRFLNYRIRLAILVSPARGE